MPAHGTPAASPLWWNRMHADDQRRRQLAAHRPSREGGIWRGPPDAAWMTQLLHGAPPPRTSEMTSEALVAHG